MSPLVPHAIETLNSKAPTFPRPQAIFPDYSLEIQQLKCPFDLAYASNLRKKKKKSATVQVIGNSHLHFNGIFSTGSGYVSLKWYKIEQLLFTCGFKAAVII